MDPRKKRIEEIFGAAIELTTPEQRKFYLERVCGEDGALRQEVEELIRAHENSGGFLTGVYEHQEDSSRKEADVATSLPSRTERPGDQIGPYKLLEQIGEGGCGVVYMAEQHEPVRRRVALKVIRLGMESRSVIARFEAERQALSMMSHPNIARVFDGGTTEYGRPYFVMELVRGRSITRYCDEHRLTLRERLKLFVEVCRAVQHAHLKGVIHRDLKPANILVMEMDGGATPKVIDFGVAKAIEQRLTEKTLFTRFGQIVGTPAYMSPEQAGLGGLDIDTRSDVYALGAILYELLAGRPPFDSHKLLEAGYEAILREVRDAEPPPPSTMISTLALEEASAIAQQRRSEPQKLTRLVRGELDWIVMKAMEKDRARRYDTANEFAKDIERFLAGQLVLANPPSIAYRVTKWVRRNRTVATAAALVAVVLMAATVVSGHLAFLALEQLDKARKAQAAEAEQREWAERVAEESRRRLVQLVVADGVRALENGDWFGAFLWFTEALRIDKPGSPAEEMHRSRIGALLQYSPRLTQFWMHDEKGINHATFSPDGRWALTAGEDRTARLWDVATGRAGAVWRHPDNVSSAAFSADGRRVITVCDDRAVRVWDTSDDRMICSPLQHDHGVSHALISPDGQLVITASQHEADLPTFDLNKQKFELCVWDAETGRPLQTPLRKRGWITHVALSPDGQWLAVRLGRWGSMVVLWNLRQPDVLLFSGADQTAMERVPIRPHVQEGGFAVLPDTPLISRVNRIIPASAACFAFSPDNRRIVIGYKDGSFRIWPLDGGSPLILQRQEVRGARREEGHRFVMITPDGKRVLAINSEGIVFVWDARTGESLRRLKRKAGELIECGPDGRLALLSTQIWDIELDEAVSPEPLHPGLRHAVFHPDGVHLLTVGLDGAARLWNLAVGLPLPFRFEHNRAMVTASSADAAEFPKRMGFLSHVLSTFTDVHTGAFSPDGRLVVTAADNGSARVWRTQSGEPVTPYVALNGPMSMALFDREGERFFTAAGEWGQALASARVWDATSGKPVVPEIQLPHGLDSAAFSPDGRWLLLQTPGEGLILDARTGERVNGLIGIGEPVRSLALSPDGNYLAAWGMPDDESRIHIWDVQTGKMAAAFIEKAEHVDRMEFSPDGRWLVTLSAADHGVKSGKQGHAARIWSVESSRPASPPVLLSGYSPGVTFSADGQRLGILAGGGDSFLWGLARGEVTGPTQTPRLKGQTMAASADLHRVVVVEERDLRVHEAMTGIPLTPPLTSDSAVRSAVFSPDGRFLLANLREGAQVWPLPLDTRPADDLVQLARFLAGREISDAGDLREWSPAMLATAAEIWKRAHRESYPLTPQQVRAWRERLVASSEQAELWSSAIFHLDQMLREGAPDEAMLLRRAWARDRAAIDELK
jgi:eukaryotic-like serine/threonine-protein kinase